MTDLSTPPAAPAPAPAPTNGNGLGGRVALVTGGSRGIGAAIVRRLAADGADVAFTYVTRPDLAEKVAADVEAAGRRALAIEADSADAAAVTDAVDRAASELGRLDILVSNAGIFGLGPLADFSVAEVDRMLAIHVRAAFVGAQAAARHLGEGGSVVTIGSCLAERVPGDGISLYAMSKAAVVGLTKGLARDLGPRGITANVVQPGPIDTDMNPADGGDAADAERELTALGRFGTVDEVAATVSHLVGDAGRYITGAAINVDGGWTA